MKAIVKSTRFRRDYKRSLKRGNSSIRLAEVLNCLVRDQPLPKRCRPHRLGGDYHNCWECHIEPDWLLIYEIEEDAVLLRRIGSHSDLFR